MGRRLTSLTDGENEISYAYDASGQRISKAVNGITTEYYYDDRGTLILMSCENGTGIGGDVMSYNMFAYCQNNPVNYANPSGEFLVFIITVVITCDMLMPSEQEHYTLRYHSHKRKTKSIGAIPMLFV